MNSDATITAHLSIGPKVNGQQNLTGFVELFNQDLVAGVNGDVAMLV